MPKLRFPGFEGEWEATTIGDVSISLDYGMNAAAKKFDGENRYIRITDIDDTSASYKSNEPVSPGGRLENRYLVSNGDILLARTGASTGKAYFYNPVDGKMYFAGFLIRARIKVDYNAKFVFYQTQTSMYRIWVKIMSMRSGQPGINSQEYSSFKFFIPPPKREQDRIVDLITKLDTRIATQNKILLYSQSLIENITDLLAAQKIKLNATFPDWKRITLAELGKTFNGLAGKTKEDFGNGSRYIQYKQIFDSSKIIVKNCGLVNILENDSQNCVQYGDIFFTISSETPDEIGMSSVLLEEVKDVYLNSFCFGFRLDSFDKLLPEFAQFLFRSKIIRNKIKKLAQGSTRYNMSKTELLKLEILLPTIAEQKKISSLLSSLDQKAQTEKAILERHEKQKKYLLKQMFV